jgi:heptosyltransferase-2
MLTGGVKLRIGFAEQGRGPLLTHRLHRGPEHRNRHQTRDYLDIVAECERVCLGPNFKPHPPQTVPCLTASHRQKQEARALIGSLDLDPSSRPLIVLNAGATNSRAKCWPGDRYAALADRLTGELGAVVVLIGAASEREEAQQVVARMKHPGALNLAGRTSMSELIGLLQLCDLLVSNDTGPAHIAAALGRPTLTIFGPTNEYETAPTGDRAEIIRAEGIECARCLRRECPIDHRCMTMITPDQVFERSSALLRSAAASTEISPDSSADGPPARALI